MGRCGRILFNAATIASLLVLLGFYVGQIWHLRFETALAGRAWQVAMNDTCFQFTWIADDPADDVVHARKVCQVENGWECWRWGMLHRDHGFLRTDNWRGEYSSYVITLLPIIIASGVMALIWLTRRMRALRRASLGGLCLSCGYDLRATPDRCPECGTVAAPSTR